MKKIIVLLSAFIALFCLTGCPNPNTPREKETKQETQAPKAKQETQATTRHTSQEKSTKQTSSKKKGRNTAA